MGLKIEVKSYPLIVDTFLKTMSKPTYSNEDIAALISILFVDEKLEKAIEILNLTLMKVLKMKQNQQAWIDREERKYQEEQAAKRRHLNINDKGEVNFCPDDVEF